MKKTILAIAMCAIGFSAFADNTATSGSSSTAVTSSTSLAGAAVKDSGNSSSSSGATVTGTTATGGAVSGVTSTGTNVNNISCLVNCTDPTASTKALADSTVQAAAIAAQAARDVANTTQTIRNTPSVNGPNLTSSNDTCMGSTSGSVNIAGMGIGGGTSWVDTNCKMLKNSRELWNMGMKSAAMALMCTDPANKEALELTGFECPQTTKARKGNEAVQKAAQVEQEQYTDPIVRARLGLDTPVASK